MDQASSVILVYAYDANDRLTNRWSAAKGNTGYAFDDVGNLTGIHYPASSSVSFTYDELNRLTQMVDGIGTTAYSYTAGNQVLTENGPFDSDTVTNTYAYRLRTELDLEEPAGVWTNVFGYDAAKRLTNVISPAGSFGYTFVPAGVSHHASLVTLPNSAVITNGFDSVARQSATYLKTSGGSVLDSYEYAYNQANQRTGITRADASTVSYGYDKIGQLKVADSSINSEDRGYTYDAAWNLNYRTNNGSLQAFGVDSKNQLTSDPDCFQDTYDANGNLTLRKAFISGVLLDLVGYSYDDENRLATLIIYTNQPSGCADYEAIPAVETDFLYDGLGRLRQKTESIYGDAGCNSWGVVSSTFTEYIYDGMRVIQERTEADIWSPYLPVVSYTRGADLSGSLEAAGGIGGLLARTDGYNSSTGAWTNNDFYFADANGNITSLIDEDQDIVASYLYDPFGNTVSQSGIMAEANLYRFSSKEIHAPSGVYYYGYRFYDPSLQRWVNRDPIEERGGANLYLFAYGDPLSHVDAFGLIAPAGGGSDGGLCDILEGMMATAPNAAMYSALLSVYMQNCMKPPRFPLPGRPGDAHRGKAHNPAHNRSFCDIFQPLPLDALVIMPPPPDTLQHTFEAGAGATTGTAFLEWLATLWPILAW